MTINKEENIDMKKVEADVVIIAGGISGLAAAISAAEKDASVIVFEKGNTTGGAANMGMGLFAVESHIQREQMVDLTIDEAFNKFMTYTHWRVDGRLVKKYFQQSASTIEWLEDMGIEFLGAFKYFNKSETTWHIIKAFGSNRPAERAGSVMVKAMTDRAKELGVQFFMETPVRKILVEDGRVCGVVAQNASGDMIEADCNAVCVCTGGFGDNPAMLKQHIGFDYGKDLFSFRIPGVTGDGMKMVWDIGGGKSDITMEITYTIPGVTDIYKTISETMRQPNLMVNLEGKRILNEELMMNPTFTGNTVARQRERCAFTIIDDSILRSYRKNGLDFITFHHNIKNIDSWDEELADYMAGRKKNDAASLSALHGEDERLTKNVFVADSIEDLAEQTGINAACLQETIDEYNKGAGTHDSFFNKDFKYMKALKGPKYYAARHYPCGYGSLGGILTDDDLKVLDTSNLPIPGLYAAGTDACTIFGDSYVFTMPGNTMGFAMNSGRMAGKNAVDYICDNLAE